MTARVTPLHASAVSVALLILTCNTNVVSAQSLGDVARREAERRTQVTSGRVYTNADLVAIDSPPAPLAPEAGAPATATATASDDSDEGVPAPVTEEAAADEAAPTIVEAREKRDEQYWRARARDLRGRLARTNTDMVGTEARLGDIDAGPQTPARAREREVIAKALARLQSEVRFRLEDLTGFEALARANNVPADWTR